jgi:hypothetical protein
MAWTKQLAALGGAVLMGWAGAACAQVPAAVETANSAFSFALIGDLPYSPAQLAPVDRMIDAINADAAVRFVLHAGDVKGGGERCDDALLRERHAQLQRVRTALVYTVGDNEWTDCHRVNNGGWLPTERLAFVRQLFFADPARSGGRQPIALTAQPTVDAAHGAYVEHALFVRNRVVFSSVHVVGSANNLAPWSGIDATDSVAAPRADRLAEFNARQAAALAWIDRTFDEAQQRDAAAVVVLWQANAGIEKPVGDAARTGFEAVLAKLKARSAAFGRPVLLAHGDFHELLIDQPLARDAEPAPKVARFTRLQGIGSPRIHWVKVTVDPKTSEVFSFEAKRVEGND